MKPIRVLIVDDSATIRSLIRQTLASEPDIAVIAEAEHPLQARQAIKDLDPDVITLDIEMPHMSGLEFLDKIMRLRPMPVIIVSTLTKRGASETLRALEIGAVDCIEKPCPNNANSFAELAMRIRIASRANAAIRRTRGSGPPPTSIKPSKPLSSGIDNVIAIGASTGGVEALLSVLSEFPANCPPTVIVQHMPPVFTTTFAERLDRQCAPHVCEATHGAPLKPGTIYLAPGGDSHLEISAKGGLHCTLRNTDRINNHRPSVDVLFSSVAQHCGPKSVGVMLTGMGRDGAAGMLDMRRAGSKTIAQDEHTSIVYGMPRAAIEIGAAMQQLPLHQIARATLQACARME